MVTPEKIVALARQWLGTPYHHQASLKGVGVDCLGLVLGGYQDLCGHIPEKIPAYSPDWGEAKDEETMLNGAEQHLIPIMKSDMQPGDILIFRFRAHFIAKHAAIMSFDAKMIHAIERSRVCEVHLSPWWHRRIAGVFRFPGVDNTWPH